MIGTANTNTAAESIEMLIDVQTDRESLPFLWFDDNTEEALHFFVQSFDQSRN